MTNRQLTYAERMSVPTYAGFFVLAIQIALSTTAAAQTAGVAGLMDREREITLALSACPPVVAPKAAVYVLGESGYVKVRDTQNGFTAIVQHSMPASQEPRCMDAEGTRTHLPRILKIAQLRAHGKSQAEIDRFCRRGVRQGNVSATVPARRRLYALHREPGSGRKGGAMRFPPNLMFYAPFMTNADVGSDGNPLVQTFVAGEGTPHALIIVPVGQHAGPGHAPAGKQAEVSK